jgi:hypothetical protein
MMTDDDYVLYKGSDDYIYSEGYRINNIFKNADISPLQSSQHPLACDGGNLNNLAIPAGLVYMHSMIKGGPDEDPNIEIDMQPASEALYDTLIKLVQIKDQRKKVKTRKHSKRKHSKKKRKKKSRKNN